MDHSFWLSEVILNTSLLLSLHTDLKLLDSNFQKVLTESFLINQELLELLFLQLLSAKLKKVRNQVRELEGFLTSILELSKATTFLKASLASSYWNLLAGGKWYLSLPFLDLNSSFRTLTSSMTFSMVLCSLMSLSAVLGPSPSIVLV